MFIVILKTIATAILAGLFLFALPFLIFKAVFCFLFLGLLFRLFAGRRRFRRWQHRHAGVYDSDFGGQQREFLTDRFGKLPQRV
ncbi:hypothetical protein [Dyadobacter fermentans]|uniref:Uncharacterized protein n=1 Tax=Dyadobacter fermentans (strain ATCC 700827 / DSM 18053 / CIP 107007 / KCTC 52180 / NS114) TaxID=471854 RepID=C6W6U1_DYAFD|nr:hypothetical protein [Dyadobacter fermentans]ACT96152.1 hypothetical protein Dfer_4952 [Dyadobacter fermentans DSM 18053]